MSETRRTRHGHTIERGKEPGSFKITLRRGGSLGIGTANDPYEIAQGMALEAILSDLSKSDAVVESLASEPEPVTVAPDATHVEKRIAALQNIATSPDDLDRLSDGEGLPRSEFLGNADRARARRRIRERGAQRHAHEDGGALSRAMSKIRSFAETLGLLERGEVE